MAATVNLQSLEFQPLDHFGLVASIIDKFNLVEHFDKQLPLSKRKGAIVSHGQRIKAMIINGLGFTASPLYLSPEFFEGKALSRLIGEGIKAEHLNDDALGRTLDAIYHAGSTRLFAEVAFNIASRHHLFGRSAKLDTTSLKLFGTDYEVEDEKSSVARPALGFSKDHRPDLKQVVMSLMVSGKGNIPLWFEGLDGNSQDKKSFHETIERVRTFQKEFTQSPSFLWVADSALYNSGKLANTPIRYLTRVPATLKKVKTYYQQDKRDFIWEYLGNGYESVWVDSNHPRREKWLLIHSEQAEKRETATLLRRIDSALTGAKSLAKALSRNKFACEKDAQQAAQKLSQSFKYHQAKSNISPVYSQGKGGTKKSKSTIAIHYQVNLSIELDDEKCQPYYQKAGRFVLASNDVDNNLLTAEVMLQTYKEQQGVEQGFRFIKDPCFHLNQVFLKKPERIEALMMIMSLCLMIYNLGQNELREQLELQEQTLPNQKGKEIRNPTLRWVFQMMKAIQVVYYPGQEPVILGINDKKRKIIKLFGSHAVKIYGI